MSDADQSGAGRREVAYRLFAAEFADADFSYSESDEDRAPNYVITPSGARANRLFVVGVLTEVEEVSEDVLRARVVDPTGAFVLYAGQYQPDEQAFLEGADPPAFVAVTGKARTFQPEDGDRIYTSIRPESISTVDAETRDRWTVRAVEQTVARIGWMARALRSAAEGDQLRSELGEQGADDGLAHGISLALAHYETTPTYLDGLREMALDAARVVAGERDEVEPPSIDPGGEGAVTAADLIETTTATVEQQSPSADEPDTPEPEQPDSSDVPQDVDARESDFDEDEKKTTPAEPAPADSLENSGERAKTERTGSGTTQTPDTNTTSASDTDTTSAPDTTSDVDAGASVSNQDSPAGEDLGDFDADEFDIDSETREQVEKEYGTNFQTGTEVEEPGEADIETPQEQPTPDAAAGGESESVETEEDSSDIAEEAPAELDEDVGEPEDVQGTVTELMEELDDGSGADRSALIAEMDERYGVDEDSVEEAIEDALMDGQCYEPDDQHLKPI